jgi:hypothetical protein
LQALADRLGLQRQPMRGGAISSVMYQGRPTALEALTEPLTVQLLSGPGSVAMTITLPVVLVLPSFEPDSADDLLFELQLGLFDFCDKFEVDWVPLWASQFLEKETVVSFALPVVAPRPRHVLLGKVGTSTFHITQDSYEEVSSSTTQSKGACTGRSGSCPIVL